jgi:PAS domain-containing protein
MTEHKRAEAALRPERGAATVCAETDAIGVLFLSHEGKLIDATDVFLKMTGWSRADIEQGTLDWRRMTRRSGWPRVKCR